MNDILIHLIQGVVFIVILAMCVFVFIYVYTVVKTMRSNIKKRKYNRQRYVNDMTTKDRYNG